jgi:hypothetical protein
MLVKHKTRVLVKPEMPCPGLKTTSLLYKPTYKMLFKTGYFGFRLRPSINAIE